MAWRCRFLAARRDQRGRVIAIPDTLVDFHTDRHTSQPYYLHLVFPIAASRRKLPQPKELLFRSWLPSSTGAYAAAGPTTWAEAEPLDRDWGRGDGVGDGGLLWDDDAEGPAADDPLGLGLRGGGAAAADFDACAYVRDVCGDAAFGELRAGRRALGGRLGEEERRRRGAVRENLQQFLRAAARLERFARALERLGGRGVRENASKPSAIVETARRRVARRFGALM